MTTKVYQLEKRIERLENVLVQLALHSSKCNYVYVNVLKEALLKNKIIKERTLILKRGK